MARFCARIARKTIYSFCLVTATFWAILLLLQVFDKVNVWRPQSRSPETSGASREMKGMAPPKKISIPRKYKAPALNLEMNFAASPYNAENKRGPTRPDESGSKPKLICWRADRTLRVFSTTSDVFQGCPVSSCVVSSNNNIIQKAHAIVFDDGRMNKQAPPQLKDERILVYYQMRTPNQASSSAKGELFSRYWKPVFNWVWSYRLGSDIFQPFAYVRNTPLPGTLDTLAAIVKKKSKVAVWINPKLNRKEDNLDDIDKNVQKGKSDTDVEGFLKKFSQETAFDTLTMLAFQASLNEPQPKKGYAMSKYYFVLAFEWADCPDYVTDLFFDAFDPRVLAVPVVRGGFKYAQHFPKEIFVNADDFDSPKGLARYLQKLAANTKTYTRMLWRKSQYVREEGVSHAWCQLCEMLHRVDEDKQLLGRYEDIHGWFNEGGSCRVSNTSDV